MRALSLWQPWASAIAIGAKQIETRSWKTPYRGPLAIHAAKTRSHLRIFEFPVLRGDIEANEALLAAGLDHPEDYPLGAIVAVCDLVGCERTEDLRCTLTPIEKALGGYEDRRFGWLLENARKLRDPLPWKGSQGFFEVPDDLIAQRLPQAA